MTIAPYFVPWAFITATLIGLTIGMTWLVYPEIVLWIFHRLWPGDLAGAWVGFSLIYHLIFFLPGRQSQTLDAATSLPILAGWLWLYLIVRFAPRRWRNQTVAMAVGLAGWAWVIGGGFQFTDRLESDFHILSQAGEESSQWPSESNRLVAQALFITKLPLPVREGLTELQQRLTTAKTASLPILPEEKELRRELLRRLEDEMDRLASYQLIQIAFLLALLTAWGLAQRPDPNL